MVRIEKLKKFLSLTRVNKAPTTGIAPKYGDTSSAYWKLYRSEAEISDKNFVETVIGNTNSMVFLVSRDSRC